MATPTDTRRYTVRKPRPAVSARTVTRPAGVSAVRREPSGDRLPGWDELARRNEQLPGSARGNAFFDRVSTARFALLVLAIAAAFTLYVGHVYATQNVLADVEQLRKDNVRLHMKYNRLKGEFDRRVGPADIYERARALGLVEDIRFGPTIVVE